VIHASTNPGDQWKKQMLEGASVLFRAEARAATPRRMYRPKERAVPADRRLQMELSGSKNSLSCCECP